jgi:hypothetical protein
MKNQGTKPGNLVARISHLKPSGIRAYPIKKHTTAMLDISMRMAREIKIARSFFLWLFAIVIDPKDRWLIWTQLAQGQGVAPLPQSIWDQVDPLA